MENVWPPLAEQSAVKTSGSSLLLMLIAATVAALIAANVAAADCYR